MKSHSFKIELGINVKSDITDYTGMVTARSQHLNGCDRYWIQPKVKKDGTLHEGMWCDEGEIELINDKIKNKPKNNNSGGFPSRVK